MSKPKGPSVPIRSIAVGGRDKIEGGYQGPRGNLGTPPTGSGSGGGSGGGSSGGGSKK